MFYVVASDLDGTLLSPNHILTPYTKKVLNLIIKKGINFILATGRHYIDLIKIVSDLKINNYTITSNGARVHNNSGKLIFSHDLDQNIALEILEIAEYDCNIITNVYRYNEWFINRKNQSINLFYSNSFKYKLYKNCKIPTDGICKIYFVCNDHKKLLFLEKKLNKKWKNKLNVSFSLPICLEVMAAGVSKGNALNKVVKLLGYNLRDCISFGDGMNDKEMLSMTGKGCIMENAQQRLKDILPFLEVIGSNENDAVSRYLYKMYIK